MAVHDFSQIERTAGLGGTLTIKPNWRTAFFFVLCVLLPMCLVVFAALTKPSIFLSLLAFIGAYYVAGYGYWLFKFWIAGYQVLICKEGLFLGEFGKINWSSIVGIHLQKIADSMSKAEAKVLFIAIADIENYRHFTEPLWKKFLLQGLGVAQRNSIIRVPLFAPKGDVDGFFKAAKVMANTYSGRLYEGWYELMPVQEAIEAQAVEAEARALFSEFELKQKSVFSFLRSAEFRALDPKEQKALAKEKLNSLNAFANKQKLVYERTLQQSKADVARREKTLRSIRSLKWIAFLSIFLVALWCLSLILKYAR